MKRNLKLSGRFALTSVAAAALCFATPWASALGLGRLAVKSSLGEALQAEIDVTSLSAEEQANLRIRVAPPESYRAANVDYNPVLPSTRATLVRRPDGRLFVRLVSDRGVQEPFVDVILEMSWATGRLVREYTLLFDPPATIRASAPPTPAATTAAIGPTTSPVMSAAPAEPTSIPSAAARAASKRDTREAARLAVRERLAAARAERAANAQNRSRDAAVARATGGAGAGAGVDEYRVAAGDTLSKIASRTQRPGVSLDQMLVALFRANPNAFMGDNMNRLKSGAVLSVPSAEAAQGIGNDAARQTITAQSADFGSYRQRLAGAPMATQSETASRQSSGKVEALVEDRKTAATATPDKLTLSKGTPASAATGPEAMVARQREQQASSARMAELSRNVDQLKQIQGAAASAPATSTAATPGGAAQPGSMPAIVAAAPVATPPPAATTTPATPATPATVPPAAAVPAPSTQSAQSPQASSAPVVAGDAAASAPVIAAATPPASAAVAPPPVRVAAKPSPAGEASFADSLLENPLYLGLGALAVLLAGFGVYRFVQRSKRDSGETSFLESRLQPDSFFGASGGQRIDTRDAGNSSSSMTYSLSQLDAIGDVDPVAEADVYLAYGRDLQAEEILKEAMRSSPERLAIRTKLLEVYAKRRDIKGFELLATQLFSLTRGDGEEWAKAQELGTEIDPDNPLYQVGGTPERAAEGGVVAEPLGVSTLPQSVMPVASGFDTSISDATIRDSHFASIDLDLDNPDIGTMSQPADLDALDPAVAPSADPSYLDTTHKMPLMGDEPSLPDHRGEPLAFDLSGISLDLDQPAEKANNGEVSLHALDMPFDEGAEEADPMARQIELAEEFQRIGDKDGARDLLREVLATASGGDKAKAQAMLEDLS